ncbi:MAG TPA: hypothetical protein VN706_24975 [Gemmatimonadaceae bacterium]|nr:hypothetical protein [Gemmatimonadaceae bacterium]
MLKRAIVAFGFFCSAPGLGAQQPDSASVHGPHYVRDFSLGVATSILLHEMGHIGTSIAEGAHPTFGFDTFRPTVFSGISARREPRKQFWFSSAGLNVQTVLDEAILDIPHARGSAFERGILGGGIGTTVFYLTIGRWGSVSDVDFMARTHVMTKTEVTLLYGSIAALQTWRISRNPAYAHFFAAPTGHGFVVGWR